jgi:hypothetical protein
MVKLPPNVTDLSDYDEPYNILVYGDAGVGKTPLGASCPDALIVTTEPGQISARRLGYKAKVWPCHDDWDEFVKMFRWMSDHPDHPFQWLVIDNATQMQEIMLRAIVATARKANSNRDEDIPAIQDYQKWYLMFDRFVKAINNLPVNTLWLAHTMRKQNEDGEDLILPAIQGQDYAQATKFCGRMQAIGYLEERLVKKGDDTVFQRRIQWRKTQTVFAKDRYIFRKDVKDRYTIVSEGEVERTDMAEIHRRIDKAVSEAVISKRSTKSKPASKTTVKSKKAATKKRSK